LYTSKRQGTKPGAVYRQYSSFARMMETHNFVNVLDGATLEHNTTLKAV
jgi:hypothetical protein